MSNAERLSCLADDGRSTVELLVVILLSAIAAGASFGAAREPAAGVQAQAAARTLAASMKALRVEAAMRQASVALEFDGDAGQVSFRCVVDGNGNGIRRVDLDAGIDRASCPARRLSDDYPGVIFGTRRSIPEVDSPSTVSPGDRAIRFGTSRFWSASPSGTTTSGTVYLSGPVGDHYAVRVLGGTGRIRVLRYDTGIRRWVDR